MEAYNEKWAEHQPESLHPAAQLEESTELHLPHSLELDRFTDSQLEYLGEWWQDARRAVVNELLAFLLRSRLRLRVVILDKVLNHPEMKWRDVAAAYGISQHALYDEKEKVLKELSGANLRTSRLIYPGARRRVPHHRKPQDAM